VNYAQGWLFGRPGAFGQAAELHRAGLASRLVSMSRAAPAAGPERPS
jgi:hypothetical protein